MLTGEPAGTLHNMLLLVTTALAGVDVALPVGSGVGAPSGPTVSLSRAVTSLDFVVEDGRSVVVVGVADAAGWSLVEEGGGVTLLLPGVTVPQSLRRDLPTAAFGASVLGVQARDSRDGARIMVQLARDARPTVEQADEVFRLVFEEPEGVQPVAAVAPVALVTQPVQGAYTSEFLIDERGDLLAPGTSLGGVADGSLVVGGYYDGGLSDLQAVAGAGLGLGGAWSTSSGFAGGSSAAPISLDLVDADIHSVLRLIAEVSGMNVVASDEVSGSVTVRLEDVPWDVALQAILASKGLAATVDGNILRVAPTGL